VSTFRIGGARIGEGHAPFVLAEMSGNHNRSLERALAIIDAAADAGAHGVKLQTYTADTMTIDHDGPGFRIDDEASPWAGYTLHRLYDEAHTPWEWHEALFARAQERGVICLSTPFDASSVEFLEGLGCPAYKIASFENTDLPLIRTAAATGKPLIISTGMASAEEIEDAVTTARSAGASDVMLLKCTSSYPADPRESNIRTIPDMATRFGCPVGLSDHTLGTGVATAAVAMGAVLIEKHLTLSRADGGVDSTFSLEPAELRALVDESLRAWQGLGAISYERTSSEAASLAFRRTLYAVADIAVGEMLTPENVRAIRPGFGLAPKHYESVLGKRAARDIARGTPLGWDLVQ